jgi:hypothetical protein
MKTRLKASFRGGNQLGELESEKKKEKEKDRFSHENLNLVLRV